MSYCPARARSVSAPSKAQPVLKTARQRILRALELGQRGQMLRKLGRDAQSSGLARAR